MEQELKEILQELICSSTYYDCIETSDTICCEKEDMNALIRYFNEHKDKNDYAYKEFE